MTILLSDPQVSAGAIIASYAAELCAVHPGISAQDLDRLSSRFVAPVEVAPEQSGGRCFTATAGISPDARAHRELLTGAEAALYGPASVEGVAA